MKETKRGNLAWMTTLFETPDNPITKDRIMKWMADTKYIEGFIHKRIHPLDKDYIDDYIQEVWLQILELDEEKIVEIYKSGKGRFTNYIKALIMNNIRSTCSNLYKHIRQPRVNEVYLTDEQWVEMIENDGTEIDMQVAVRDKVNGICVFDYEKDAITSELKLTEDATEEE